MTPQVKHMGLEEVVFLARRCSLARAREERTGYNRGKGQEESDQEWRAGQEEEILTLTEPILSGRL